MKNLEIVYLIDIIPYLSKSVEFFTRFILVNIPSALLVSFPELDRISNLVFTYLIFQVIGYCWAFLVNAAFAISCQIASFLPFNHINNEATTLQLIASFYFVYSSARVVISYAKSASYIGYQSLQDFPHISLISKTLNQNIFLSSLTLFIPVIFIEISIILAPDICSYNSTWTYLLCQHTLLQFFTHSYPNIRKIMFFVCMLIVLQLWQLYLYQFPRWDRAIKAANLSRFSTILIQLSMLLISITTILTLGGLFLSLYLPVIYEHYFHLLWLPNPETWAWFALFGWTIWLLLFSKYILLHSIQSTQINNNNNNNNSNNNKELLLEQFQGIKLQYLLKNLRLSQIIIYFIYFVFFSGTVGIIDAQLNCTLISIAIPSIIVIMYILLISSMQVKLQILLIGIPFCLFISILVSFHMTSRIGGRGSILLIFLHSFSKLVQYFGQEPHNETGYEGELFESLTEKEQNNDEKEKINNQNISENKNQNNNKSKINSSKTKQKENKLLSNISLSKSTNNLHQIKNNQNDSNNTKIKSNNNNNENNNNNNNNNENGRKRKKSISLNDLQNINISTNNINDENNNNNNNNNNKIITDINERNIHHEHAKRTLADRGLENSSLVSVSIPSTVRKHWITSMSSRTIGFSLHLARTLTLTDNVLAGIMRAGTAVGVIFTVLFGIISVFSVLQQNLNLFPTFISYHSNSNLNSNSILINHIISNVTLIKNPCIYNIDNQNYNEYCNINDEIFYQNLEKPLYASCSMRWKTLSILDFSILSELSYFDDTLILKDNDKDDENCKESENNNNNNNLNKSPTIQKMLDELFPDLGFNHIKSTSNNTQIGWNTGFEGSHPMYLEVYSEKLNVTVIAVRGTDVGRLHDFLEDVKLFAEPVLISLLSCIFPLMRLSSDTTTSTIIQILHESNSFFGLVGEAEYYQPLVERVKEISKIRSNKNNEIILTGHSLGGGLSRIVAALTHLPSISFAPPGIALSHRKFSVLGKKSEESNEIIINHKIGGMNDLYDQSMAIITDFDMIPYVDQQVGLIQKIMCDVSNKSHQNACHLLEGTICHILKHCGDHRYRFIDCNYSFNFDVLIPSLTNILWEHRYILFPILTIISLMITLAILPEIV